MIKASPEFFRTAGNGSLIFLDTPFVSAFTTRIGGTSSGNFSSFNLYFGRGDKLENVERNWEILREYLDFNGKIVLPQQIHSSTIKYVPENLKQDGINHIPQCDGLITDKKGVLTGVMFADCLPVLIWGTRYAAILHAGWRGLASGIIGNGVRELISKGENPSELNAALGPCIAAEDYEVGQEVVRAFTDVGLENAVERSDSRSIASLVKGAIYQLLKFKVANIYFERYNTYGQSDKFFSYRRNGAKVGEMLMFFIL
ncbi:laccase domain-containing protein [bacterium]|nr:laccase domain-containing protein [bacterium]